MIMSYDGIKNDSLMSLTWAIIPCVIVLGGCATDQSTVLKQHVDAALAERPLVKIECPETGCLMRSFTVNNPNQVNIPKITNGWDTANQLGSALLGVVDKAGTMYLITETMKEGFKYVRSNDNSVTTTTTTTTDGSHNSQSSNTETSNSHNRADTSTANSHNSQVTDDSHNSSDASSVANTSSTTTSTPTTTTTTTTNTTTTTDNSVRGDNSNEY